MDKDNLIKLVQDVSKSRGEIPTPEEFVVKALEQIESGEVEVERYPLGAPSLKGVSELAAKLHAESSPIN